MAQSLASILVHLIFSTKNRLPAIVPEIEEELHRYICGVLREHTSPALAVGGTADHVHILFSLGKTVTYPKVIEEVKSSSSRWIKTKGPAVADFYWQNGYGAFSVGQSNVQGVREYIAGQKEHHRGTDFKDEFRAFLRKYRVEYDERYVWD